MNKSVEREVRLKSMAKKFIMIIQQRLNAEKEKVGDLLALMAVANNTPFIGETLFLY